MSERKERCETCRFWSPGERESVEFPGYCQRMPPTILESKSDPSPTDDLGRGCRSYFPITDFDDWCGEWQAIATPTPGIDTTPESAEELKRDIQAVLKQLTYREREVIKLRYGLGDGIVYTLEECGHIFKVTRERIRAIEKKAITKIGMLPGADKLLERCSKLQQSRSKEC